MGGSVIGRSPIAGHRSPRYDHRECWQGACRCSSDCSGLRCWSLCSPAGFRQAARRAFRRRRSTTAMKSHSPICAAMWCCSTPGPPGAPPARGDALAANAARALCRAGIAGGRRQHRPEGQDDSVRAYADDLGVTFSDLARSVQPLRAHLRDDRRAGNAADRAGRRGALPLEGRADRGQRGRSDPDRGGTGRYGDRCQPGDLDRGAGRDSGGVRGGIAQLPLALRLSVDPHLCGGDQRHELCRAAVDTMPRPNAGHAG